MYEIYESLSSFWKNSEKNMIRIKHIITLDLLSPHQIFEGKKKIKLIKEGSTDMHIEEKETNFE